MHAGQHLLRHVGGRDHPEPLDPGRDAPHPVRPADDRHAERGEHGVQAGPHPPGQVGTRPYLLKPPPQCGDHGRGEAEHVREPDKQQHQLAAEQKRAHEVRGRLDRQPGRARHRAPEPDNAPGGNREQQAGGRTRGQQRVLDKHQQQGGDGRDGDQVGREPRPAARRVAGPAQHKRARPPATAGDERQRQAERQGRGEHRSFKGDEQGSDHDGIGDDEHPEITRPAGNVGDRETGEPGREAQAEEGDHADDAGHRRGGQHQDPAPVAQVAVEAQDRDTQDGGGDPGADGGVPHDPFNRRAGKRGDHRPADPLGGQARHDQLAVLGQGRRALSRQVVPKVALEFISAFDLPQHHSARGILKQCGKSSALPQPAASSTSANHASG